MPEAVLSPVRNENVNMGNILKPLLSKSAAAGKEVTERADSLFQNYFSSFLTYRHENDSILI